MWRCRWWRIGRAVSAWIRVCLKKVFTKNTESAHYFIPQFYGFAGIEVRIGLGLRATRIGTPARRDRLLLVCALAYIFIVTLGQAGEHAKVDRFLKVNTSSTRQLSLFTQGLEWLQLLDALGDAVKTPLLEAFHKLLNDNDFSTLVMNDTASTEI